MDVYPQLRLKMARDQCNILIVLLQIILVATNVRCESLMKYNSDFVEFKESIFSIRDIDIPKMISETLFSNWTDDHRCSFELDAIKNGLMHYEEWAFESKLTFFLFKPKISYVHSKLPNDWIRLFSCRCMGKASIWNFKREFF